MWTRCAPSAASYIAGTCQSHIAPTYATTPKAGWPNGPAARSIRWMRRVAGRRIHLVSAEREEDRGEVGDQQVLDHVEGRELLAEEVDRRDQRDEQRHDPGRPQRRAALAGGARAALLARPAPAQPVDAA